MKGNIIYTGTVTYAIKGRDILRNEGFKARVEKSSGNESGVGCGYGIAVDGDVKSAEELLLKKGVKILKRKKQ